MLLPALATPHAGAPAPATRGTTALLQPPVAALQPNGVSGSGGRVMGLASDAPIHLAPRAALAAAAATGPLPASADLSQNSPPVAYQGPVASCVAWVAGYYMRGYYAKRDGYYPQGGAGGFAPMFVFSQVTKGQNAGITFNAALDLMQAQGIDTRADYSQGDTDFGTLPTPAEQANAANYKISGYSVLFQGANQGATAQQAIEQAIAGGDPVGLGLPVYDNFWNADATHDVVDVTNMGTNHGNHAVVAAKYDANGVWVENQWGTGWGLNGWVELSWAFVDQYVWQAVTLHPAAGTPPAAPSDTPAASATATATDSATPAAPATDTAQPAATATATQPPTSTATPLPPATSTAVPTHTPTPRLSSASRRQATRRPHAAPARHVRSNAHVTRNRSHRHEQAARRHRATAWLSPWQAPGGRITRVLDPLHGLAVRLGAHGRRADAAYRDLTLPRQARHLTLRFSYRALALAGNTGTHGESRLLVTVLNPRTGRLLAHVLRATPALGVRRKGLMSLPPMWRTVTYDLTRFRGRRVRLLFSDRHGRAARVVVDLASVHITVR